jgi:hypothetical protein
MPSSKTEQTPEAKADALVEKKLSPTPKKMKEADAEKKSRKTKIVIEPVALPSFSAYESVSHGVDATNKKRSEVINELVRFETRRAVELIEQLKKNAAATAQLDVYLQNNTSGHTKKDIADARAKAAKALKATENALLESNKNISNLHATSHHRAGVVKGFRDLGDFPASNSNKTQQQFDAPTLLKPEIATFFGNAKLGLSPEKQAEVKKLLLDHKVCSINLLRDLHTLYAMANGLILSGTGASSEADPTKKNKPYMKISPEYKRTFASALEYVEETFKVDLSKGISYSHISTVIACERYRADTLTPEQKEKLKQKDVVALLARVVEFVRAFKKANAPAPAKAKAVKTSKSPFVSAPAPAPAKAKASGSSPVKVTKSPFAPAPAKKGSK